MKKEYNPMIKYFMSFMRHINVETESTYSTWKMDIPSMLLKINKLICLNWSHMIIMFKEKQPKSFLKLNKNKLTVVGLVSHFVAVRIKNKSMKKLKMPYKTI